MTRALAAALALVALAAAASAARADDVAEAKAHFRKGAELYRAKRWRDAIAEFEAAYRLKPAGAIHYDVAQCRERLEEWPGALRSYEDYLREVPDAKDRAAVRASIRRIEERLRAAGVQALVVYSDPPGAEVRIDGRGLGSTPFQIVLPPGTYALALALEGREPVQEEIALAAGSSRVVDRVLREIGSRTGATPALPAVRGPASAAHTAGVPDLSARPAASVSRLSAAPERAAGKRRVYTWTAAAAAVAAAGAGAWFGWSARQDAHALDTMSQPDAATAQRYATDARSKARTANVLYAVAGTAGAAGVTLFFVEGRF